MENTTASLATGGLMVGHIHYTYHTFKVSNILTCGVAPNFLLKNYNFTPTFLSITPNFQLLIPKKFD